LTVAGASTFNDPTTFNDTVTIAASKKLTANGNVAVGGTSTLRDTTITTTSSRGVTVYGRSNFRGDVYINGNKVTSGGSVPDPLTIGTVTVQDALTTDKAAAVSLGGNVAVGGTTTVAGLSSLHDTKITSTSDRGLTVYGQSNFNGDVYLKGEKLSTEDLSGLIPHVEDLSDLISHVMIDKTEVAVDCDVTVDGTVNSNKLNVRSHILTTEEEIDLTAGEPTAVLDLTTLDSLTMLIKLYYFGDVANQSPRGAASQPSLKLFGQQELLVVNGELKHPYLVNKTYINGYESSPSLLTPTVEDYALSLTLTTTNESIPATTNGIVFLEILMHPEAEAE
jgi:cytoskeletal protein CcmA (bactofilin family)